MNKYMYCDAEYNSDTGEVMSFVFWDGCSLDTVKFDCRDHIPNAKPIIQDFIRQNQDKIYVAFNISAELWALSQMGVDVKPLSWIDLMVECNMIMGTHPAYFSKARDFVTACKKFGVKREDFVKKDMYKLILSKPGRDFTEEEFDLILEYNESDVRPLKPLLGKIQHVLIYDRAVAGIWKPEHSLERAEYCKACFLLQYRSKGLPIDEDWLKDIDNNLDEIRIKIVEECMKAYGENFWVWDHLALRYKESRKNLENYIIKLGLDATWKRTEKSANLSMDAAYFDDMVKEYPHLKTLKTARDLVNQTKKFQLPSLVKDGYVKPGSKPFYTVTSRNQPMVAEGFVLNMAPWIRSVVRPKAGMVLVGLDWSKQEIAIAAALTQDKAFLDAYNTGDIYEALAKRSGAIPPDANLKDKSHPLHNHWKQTRQAYKSVQLGLGYGMGKDKLGASIYADLNMGKDHQVITMEDARKKGIEIYKWHKATFRDYWNWLEVEARVARSYRVTFSKDYWVYFTDSQTAETQIINFPIQSNAAAMLRKAVKSLAFETDIDVCCTLHDAIYFNCRIEDVKEHTRIVQEHMARAVVDIIGPDIKIETEPKISTEHTGYLDERGLDTLNMIRELVLNLKTNPLPKRRVRPDYLFLPEKRRRALKEHMRLRAYVYDDDGYLRVSEIRDISGNIRNYVRNETCFKDVFEIEQEIAYRRGIEPCYVIVELKNDRV